MFQSQNAAISLILLMNFVMEYANHQVLAAISMNTFASLMEWSNVGKMSTVVISILNGAQLIP